MATARDIIEYGFQLAGLIGVGENLLPEQGTQGINIIRTVFENWQIDGLMNVEPNEIVHPLTTNQGEYTIGLTSGSDIQEERPSQILNMFSRDVSGKVDYKCTPIDLDTYNGIAVKSIGSIPRYYYYDRSFPIATIKLYPTPNTGYNLHIFSRDTFNIPESINDEIDLPPGYQSLLEYEISVRAPGLYGIDIKAQNIKFVQETRYNVKQNNSSHRPIKKVLMTGLSNTYGDYDGGLIRSGRNY